MRAAPGHAVRRYFVKRPAKRYVILEISRIEFFVGDRCRQEAQEHVKSNTAYFHCGDQLRTTLAGEIAEVETVISAVKWTKLFQYSDNSTVYEHQTAYNKAFAVEFNRLGWEPHPVLRIDPRLVGDFRKGLVFVEIQFGNSAALYRDYYKFQYGLANGLLSLAVLIVPNTARAFFPTRPHSVHGMAEYAMAYTCLTVLPINVPTMLIGLLPTD